jgi:hypothetical protein
VNPADALIRSERKGAAVGRPLRVGCKRALPSLSLSGIHLKQRLHALAGADDAAALRKALAGGGG